MSCRFGDVDGGLIDEMQMYLLGFCMNWGCRLWSGDKMQMFTCDHLDPLGLGDV